MMKLLRKLLYMDAHICPPWAAFSLDTRLRRLIHKPESIVSGFIRAGDTVLDVGCGPGFFTMAMAKMTGEDGCVIAVDLQRPMLERLRRRAERYGVLPRIKLHQCTPDELGVTDEVDFALVFWMAHEVPDLRRLFAQIASVLKPGAPVLLAEPGVHVSAARFRDEVEAAAAAGLRPRGELKIRWSRAVLLSR